MPDATHPRERIGCDRASANAAPNRRSWC